MTESVRQISFRVAKKAKFWAKFEQNFEINIGFITLIEQSVLIQSSQSTANSEMSSSEYLFIVGIQRDKNQIIFSEDMVFILNSRIET